MANTYSAGIVTAYGAAKRGGYTGTYEQFCAEQAGFAGAAQQVRQDKESVEATVNTFSNTTVPAAVQSVTDEGTTQIGLVDAAGTDQIAAVESAGSTQVSAVNTAGGNQVASVNSAGSTQVGAVNSAGETQVGNVQAEGATQVQAVEDKGEEVLETIPQDYSALSNKVVELSEVVDKKAPAIYDTASGDIASFGDGADDMPVKELVATIEPMQDLHGYDSPWPAGGGKNLALATFGNKVPSVTNGEMVSANGWSTDFIPVDASKNYVFSKFTGTGASIGYVLYYDSSKGYLGVVQITPSTASIRLDTYSSWSQVGFVKLCSDTSSSVNPQIQLEIGTTATDYAPYSNICPITGHTGMNVPRTGKNLLDSDSLEPLTSNVGNIRNGWKIDKPGIYTVSAQNKGSWIISSRKITSGVYGQTTYISTSDMLHNATYTVNDGEQIIVFDVNNSTLEQSKLAFKNAQIQVELGSTATDYAPYTGTTIPISWETEAGTVYGGTLDVSSGKLVVDKASFDGGAVNWEKVSNSNYRNFATILSPAGHYVGNTPTVVSSAYKSECNSTSSASDDNYVWLNSSTSLSIKDTGKANMTVADFKTAITGIQFVYELVTPVEYQLTPQEVTTLLGTNNIWTDTGSVSVEYPADTKLYIDRKIAEALS